MPRHGLDPWPWEPPERHRRRRRTRFLVCAIATAAFWGTCVRQEMPTGMVHASFLGGSSAVDVDDLYGPCRVTNVVDGDTVDVACGSDWGRVRLLNVDTPERGEPGFREAREALEDMISREDIYLAFEEPGEPSYGRYGRLLAYLLDEDGTNLNAELVREGWSPYYRKYGDGRFPEEFEEAEQDAAKDAW